MHTCFYTNLESNRASVFSHKNAKIMMDNSCERVGAVNKRKIIQPKLDPELTVLAKYLQKIYVKFDFHLPFYLEIILVSTKYTTHKNLHSLIFHILHP